MNDLPHQTEIQTKKPRNKLLIFGSVGCLLMVLLCFGGIGGMFYLGQDIAQEMMAVESSLLTSPELEAEIGSPVTVKPSLTPSVEIVDGVNYSTLSGTVSGPQGEGTYQARFIVEGVQYELQSLTVEVNDKQIEISDQEELDLGIDLGE
jgi:hypothetical protein